jgi:hypothetical protein
MNGSPIAKLESDMSAAQRSEQKGEGTTTMHATVARTLAIHTDARGAPLAMTDATQKVVWQSEDNLTDQAWGRLKAIHAPTGTVRLTQPSL